MKFYILIVTFLLATSLQAQETSSRPFPTEEDGLLWRITGKDITGDCYVFGTMHLIEKEHFLFPKKLEKAVKKTDKLIMELAGLPSQTEALELVMLKEGSFFDFFTKEQTDSILIWVKDKMGMDEPMFRAAFSKMKPFAIVQMASQMQFMGKTESYEMTFEKIANENDIPLLGLETVSEQMALFDNLTDQQQAEMVMEGIRNSDQAIEFIQQMQLIYVQQNIDELYKMITDEGGVIAKEQQQFLNDRNHRWIPILLSQLSNQSVFIAVGAGHLGGPNGIVRLLEKEGYKLTPIKL